MTVRKLPPDTIEFMNENDPRVVETIGRVVACILGDPVVLNTVLTAVPATWDFDTSKLSKFPTKSDLAFQFLYDQVTGQGVYPDADS